jgi:hypothetical protein
MEVPEVPDINRASNALEICVFYFPATGPGNQHRQLAAPANATGNRHPATAAGNDHQPPAPADGTGNRSNLGLLRVGSV